MIRAQDLARWEKERKSGFSKMQVGPVREMLCVGDDKEAVNNDCKRLYGKVGAGYSLILCVLWRKSPADGLESVGLQDSFLRVETAFQERAASVWVALSQEFGS